jgi:hypothetical protein
VSAREKSDNFRAIEEVGPKRTAHDQLIALTSIRLLHGSDHLLGVRDHRSSFRQEQPTRMCEFDVTRRPVEEGHLQFVLKTPNLLAQGRLRYVELRRCSPEVATARKYRKWRNSMMGQTHITDI